MKFSQVRLLKNIKLKFYFRGKQSFNQQRSESLWWFQHRLVQFSHSVISNSLWTHEPQHARPPCPSPTPRVHPNPCPLSRWCHPTIQSSVAPICPCLNISQHQSLFQWVSSSHRWPKYWSFSLNISPTNEHRGLISFRIDWLDLNANRQILFAHRSRYQYT